VTNEWLRPTENGAERCWWPGDDVPYINYHDTEWGRPVTDDTRLFEKLCLEGFQAGLSWLTILRKRENFRTSFHSFDMDEVARFSERDINRLLEDVGIVRHRGKIEAKNKGMIEMYFVEGIKK
jgi:DNA-3-methyladenine glycosylase I